MTGRTFGQFNELMRHVYVEQLRRRQERRARKAESIVQSIRQIEPFISEPVPLAPAQQPKQPRQRRERTVLGHVTSAEKPCKCGSVQFVIGQGKGPHVARLCCSSCGRLRRWMGKHEFERYSRADITKETPVPQSFMA